MDPRKRNYNLEHRRPRTNLSNRPDSYRNDSYRNDRNDMNDSYRNDRNNTYRNDRNDSYRNNTYRNDRHDTNGPRPVKQRSEFYKDKSNSNMSRSNGDEYNRETAIYPRVEYEKNPDEQTEQTEDIKISYELFEEMNLSENLLHGIYSYGFEKPSVIQQRGIVPFTSGRDIIGQAQSGTGKTGTFTIGTLQRVDDKLNETQAIILAPTRELAKQIYKVILSISSYTKINIREVTGGIRELRGRNNLQSQSQIIVGTPGKVLDELYRGTINNKFINVFVLDEADEMLSKGFRDQLNNIFKYIPKEAQIALFSATMPNEVLKITTQIMNNPFRILIKNEELTLEGIRQYYIYVEHENAKFDTLCDLYSTIAVTQSIIYCNTKKKVYNLTSMMQDNNFPVACMYGDISQIDRNKIMEKFRNGDNRVLITTDVLSRGIDVQQVSLVINYDLPNEVETYIHRIGRSGRFGRKGTAINLITNYDVDQKEYIEKFYSTMMEELPNNVADVLS